MIYLVVKYLLWRAIETSFRCFCNKKQKFLKKYFKHEIIFKCLGKILFYITLFLSLLLYFFISRSQKLEKCFYYITYLLCKRFNSSSQVFTWGLFYINPLKGSQVSYFLPTMDFKKKSHLIFSFSVPLKHNCLKFLIQSTLYPLYIFF